MAIIAVKKPSQRELVEPGHYLVRIIGEEVHDKRISFKLEIQDDGEHHGQWLFYSVPMEGKGSFYLHSFVQKAMQEPELEAASFDTALLEGRYVYVDVEHDHYNGKTYAKVMNIEPAPDADLPF